MYLGTRGDVSSRVNQERRTGSSPRPGDPLERRERTRDDSRGRPSDEPHCGVYDTARMMTRESARHWEEVILSLSLSGSLALLLLLSLSFCLFVSHSRSLLAASHASSTEPERTEERTRETAGDKEEEREFSRDLATGSPACCSQDGTLTNCRRGSASDACARLAASRPLLPSSTWNPA